MTIENFRQFGSGTSICTVPFRPGVTALVGENDSGKTAIIDAIRYSLLTRDSEYFSVQPEDFHVTASGKTSSVISITCRIDGLSLEEQGAFAEFLTFEPVVGGGDRAVLFIQWQARKLASAPSSRRWVDVTVACGRNGEGPTLDSTARKLLSAAYLKPLRDATRELAAGRRSRLSQILGNIDQIREGHEFDAEFSPENGQDADLLSLVGIARYTKALVNNHGGIESVRQTLNDGYLSRMQLSGSTVRGDISMSEGGNDEATLRQLLERLELVLQDSSGLPTRGPYGLGSKNLLFMACELLLLGTEAEGMPLLLVEEPEAHLHPQLQLRLMDFLSRSADSTTAEQTVRPVQTIVTTHSPNLASQLPLESLVLVSDGKAFSLAPGQTLLAEGDYRFLERFLDSTKANLFFARGVLVVEGHAESILLPTIAKLIGRDLTKHGVSIVNVGSTGLSRYSKILQRAVPEAGELHIPVACITDLDVMPDCAPEILGLVDGPSGGQWDSKNRKWRALKDFSVSGMSDLRDGKRANDCQNVRTFIADQWTLEFAMARAGLPRSVYVAARLATDDAKVKSTSETIKLADIEFNRFNENHRSNLDVLCSHIYKVFKDGASKAIAAQHLAVMLEDLEKERNLSAKIWRTKLPNYIVEAIDYVTSGNLSGTPSQTDKSKND